MLKVVIVSLTAGGGHKTAMYSLGQSLQAFAPQVSAEYYLSPSQKLEHTHRIVYTKFVRLYNLGYRLIEYPLPQLLYRFFSGSLVREIREELRPLMLRTDIEVIISTHFMQTDALLQLKYELNSPVKIIIYIPDFDLSTVHFPRYKNLQADAVLAQSPALLEKLGRDFGVSPDDRQQAGYLPRSEFGAARMLSREEARQRVAKFKMPLAETVSENAYTIVATGGAYWVSLLHKQLSRLAASEKFNWKESQILVACGNNAAAYQAYTSLRAVHPQARIIPLPFLNYEQMSFVLRSADTTVLSGIAPATMYELIECEAGPVIIHRINPGPERYNLEYVLSRNLMTYIPDALDLVHFLENLSHDKSNLKSLREAFLKAAATERQGAMERAVKNAAFIQHIAARAQADHRADAQTGDQTGTQADNQSGDQTRNQVHDQA